MTVRTARMFFSKMEGPMASLAPKQTLPPQWYPYNSSSWFQISTPLLQIRSSLAYLGPYIFQQRIQNIIRELYILQGMQISLAILLVTVTSAALTYHKIIINDSQALCLDGSRAAYYQVKGDPSKVLLYFEGGAWCGDNDLSSTLQNCYQRSKTDLGSSTQYPPTISYSTGILSDDGDNYFNDWTRIFMKYCDGSGHQGTRTHPVLYKGAELFFRGQNITISRFEQINKQLGIFEGKVSQLVVSGGSAGGLAAYHWTNHVQSKIKPSTKLWSLPDSGIFLDFPNIQSQQNTYRTWFQNLLKLSNEEVGTPLTQCNEQNKDQLWKCMFVQNFYQHITTPLFTAQSLYDSYSLYTIVGLQCLTGASLGTCSIKERQLIEEYRVNTLDLLLGITNRNGNGAWAPACVNHCYATYSLYSSYNFRIPFSSDFTLIMAISDWMEGIQTDPRHIDFGEWPSNRPCSGVPQTTSS